MIRLLFVRGLTFLCLLPWYFHEKLNSKQSDLQQVEPEHEHVDFGFDRIMGSEAHPRQESILVQERDPALGLSTSNHVAMQQPGVLLQ